MVEKKSVINALKLFKDVNNVLNLILALNAPQDLFYLRVNVMNSVLKVLFKMKTQLR